MTGPEITKHRFSNLEISECSIHNSLRHHDFGLAGYYTHLGHTFDVREQWGQQYNAIVRLISQMPTGFRHMVRKTL